MAFKGNLSRQELIQLLKFLTEKMELKIKAEFVTKDFKKFYRKHGWQLVDAVYKQR